LNVGVLVTIGGLIVFGSQIFDFINEKIEDYHAKLAYFFGFVLLIFVFGCVKGNVITNKDKDWVNRALELGNFNTTHSNNTIH